MTRIVGIDPGKTTGLVSFSVDEEDQIQCLESYELSFMGVGHYLASRLTKETIVVCEAFLITTQTAKNSQAPWSLEAIGLARYFSELNGCQLKFYPPSFHKRLVTKKALQKVGLYVSGEHSRDAASVGLYYVITELKLLLHSLRKEED